jgi:hypothetical protein
MVESVQGGETRGGETHGKLEHHQDIMLVEGNIVYFPKPVTLFYGQCYASAAR